MAAIDQYIERIQNLELKEQLKAEITRLTKKKRFGLVYENHLPDNVLMHEVTIRRGTKVVLRNAKPNDIYEVQSIEDGDVCMATCRHLNTFEDKVFPITDLVAIAQCGDVIYPYLKPMDSVQNAPDSNLWHTLIEADNYHALQTLAYLYPGMVDCIYIDPPYNKPDSHDWKYNCDYVDGTDAYRHSKWLSMMEARLKIAKKLLNPKGSVLIITIDELEYNHLGCLLEQMFPEGTIQMVTSVISGKGVSRDGQFSRVEEYIYCVTFGDMPVLLLNKTMLNDTEEITKKQNAIDFLGFRRRNKGNFRTSRPHQFYPIFVDNITGRIVNIGDAITPEIRKEDVSIPNGCTALWPLDPSGSERIWSLVPASARNLLAKGCLKVVNWDKDKCKGSVKYLASGMVQDIEDGIIFIDERDEYGNIISGHYTNIEDDTLRPRKVWVDKLHNASSFGTLVLKKVLGEKRFDFPKSLYAVHDTIRFFVANKPNALILDFFAGSGTTLHAVNLLNKEDGGHRRCIMVTNNEIGEPKESELTPQGIHPGCDDWEKWGIARYVNWPRTKCSILGVDVNGNPIDGEYITSLTETKTSVRKFTQINYMVESPVLKQKKALVTLINKQKDVKLPTMSADAPFLVSEEDNINASILFDVNEADAWIEALDGNTHIINFYIVASRDVEYRRIKEQVAELMGPIEESISVKIPMSDGFKTNAAFFKLGFLDKRSVERGRQLHELIPLLWMKAGAVGRCPESIEGDYSIFPENKMAVLKDEAYFPDFKDKLQQYNIDVVFLITDSQNAYLSMTEELNNIKTYQLYNDYLENFRINYATK